MKPKIIQLVLVLVTSLFAKAQNIDSLKIALSNSKEDTNKVKIYSRIAFAYQWSYPDSAFRYCVPGLDLARKLNFRPGEIANLVSMSEALSMKGNYSKALEMSLKALKLAETIKAPSRITISMYSIGNVYFYSGDYPSALKYYLLAAATGDRYAMPLTAFIGEAYYHVNELDSAMLYISKAYHLSKTFPIPRYYLGKIYSMKGDLQKALAYFREGVQLATAKLDKVDGALELASIFKKMGKVDSAIFYAKEVLGDEFASIPAKQIEAGSLLTELYKPISIDSAFKYQEIMLAANDSLFSKEKLKQMQNLSFNEQLRQREILADEQAYKSKMKIYSLLGIGVILFIAAVLLWRNNRYKQKAFNLLQQQKTETDVQKSKAEGALYELKATQQQLIQSEKMASLGELTAGIAHEIQNPLNFVNNFSEVNSELLDELEQEVKKGNLEEVKVIARDIKDNEEKINHHGKRADAIVKSMLQHSRASTGQKEPTNINALADEYLRLAYHGLRAKDKSFNANMKTDFDQTIKKINIVPQDIGRVLLNLFTNAFYSVTEKNKHHPENYEPTVSVSTNRLMDKVEIKVRDNGMGIPQKVMDKIFQPFFTTKPTGQGTGLGLSLSYDIITKAHGGQLKMETKEGEFAEFIIILPTDK